MTDKEKIAALEKRCQTFAAEIRRHESDDADRCAELERLEAEIERLKAEREAAQNTHAMYGRENAALRARNERLERALRNILEMDRLPIDDANNARAILNETEEPRMSDKTHMTALPAEHPTMKAWNRFCATDEFKNALRWAVETKYDDGRPISDIQREQHAKGAIWLAFTKGLDETEESEK